MLSDGLGSQGEKGSWSEIATVAAALAPMGPKNVATGGVGASLRRPGEGVIPTRGCPGGAGEGVFARTLGGFERARQ